MVTARASEMPVLIVNGDDSPRSRIGRGLESIGGMTAETLQRISTAVGGVVKSPVVLISKVGGLASPRVATLTAPPEKSLAERVYHLENQMKGLEENFSPMTVGTKLDLSTSSHKEKPRIAKSLLQEMEPDRTLEKRVQILEDLVNERMERFEKILSNIQSRLDHVEFSWRESVAGEERQESVSGEPEYYDAEQSDNLEILEASEENFFGGSPPLEKSRGKETSSAAPTTAEHVEPLQEIDDEKNDAFLEPQVVSTPVYSKESFLVQPSSEPVESVRRDDAGNLPASLDRQLDSALEELHGSFVTEASAAAASAKFSEIARPVTAEEGILAQGEHEPDANGQQPAQEHEQHLEQGHEQEHGQEIGQEHGLATAQAPGQEHEQEPAPERGQEPTQKLAEELGHKPDQQSEQQPAQEHGQHLEQEPEQEHGQEIGQEHRLATARAPGQEPTQEPAEELGHKPEHQSEQQPPQEDLTRNSAMALPPSEPQVTSKSTESQELLAEESLAAVPSTKFEEPPLVNAADESGTRDLPLTPTAEEPRVDTVVSPEKSLSSTSFHQSGNPELLENLEQKYSDAPDSSSTPQEALERKPLTAAPPNTEIAQGHDAGKSDNLHTSSEPQLEESKEALANEPVKAVHTSSEPQLEESKETLANEPVKAVPSPESTEPDQEVGDGQSGAILASSESQLRPTLEESQEGFVKEPLADAESASKSVDLEESLADEPSAVTASAKLAPESDVDKINTGIVEEFPLTPIAEALEREPLTAAPPNTEIAQGHDAGKSDNLHTSSEPQLEESKEALANEPVKAVHTSSEPQLEESKETLANEPVKAVPSSESTEPDQEVGDGQSGAILASSESQLRPTLEESQEGFVKEPLADAESASKSVDLEESLADEPSAVTTSAKLAPESDVGKINTGIVEEFPLTPIAEALEREPLTAAPPNTEIAQGHDAGKSDNLHTSSEPQLEESKEALANEPVKAVHTSSEPQLEESKETLANEPVKAVPSSESTEPDQEVGDGQSGAILASSESQLRPILEESQEGFVKEPLADAESASKSVDLEESLADEPSAVTASAKLAPESDVDKINTGIVEESPLTPIAEELQNGSVDPLAEGKHGQDEADRKLLEDVKINAQPIEEAIPRTQSDLTHFKLNPEAAEDATELQSQGSFLAFGGATSVDSKEALLKEPSSSKLLELFEEENNSGKRGPVPADSPMTSTAEEPQKPLADAEPKPEPALASAKSVPKGHARWRGFARSSSEPQFAYKLEEHRKALAKESSVAAAAPPSASKLGEEHAEEEFGDTQCLPFRILGEGKPPRKESEFKLREDVKSPATKSETAESSPYVLEPKPSKIKEKKKKEKKEKKERKPVAAAEEKERRLSLGVGEMERKSSLSGEEKGSKDSPRAEEKHKQPFWHFRGRLRHAFSVNKEL